MSTLPNLVTCQNIHKALNQWTVQAKFWPPNFIEEIKNPHVKNNLRSFHIKNLTDIFGHAIQEDQKQKIRALDFGES